MLKSLRKKGFAKKILWIIAIVIIISFGFMGTAYLLTSNPATNYAGKIFGKKITLDDFDKTYQDVRIQAIMRYGEKFNEIRQFLNMESETWDRLILLHEAKKRSIKIPDAEVVKTIEQYPFFHRDGQFDTLLYNDILRYAFRIKARGFEESIRDSLKFQRMYEQETSSLFVTEDEILQAFQKQNEKVQVSYIFVSPDPFKNEISFDESEAQQYYDKNKLEFLMPPTINVEYISFDFPEIDVDADKDVELEAEPDADSKPVSEKPEQTDSESSKLAVREKSASIFQELLVNPNMEEIAKKNGLEVKASGFFSMEQPNLALGWSYDFLNKIFQLEENQISEPFETPNGLHIVKIKEKREAYVPVYSEVKEKVKEALLQKKAKKIAKEKSNEYLKSLKEEIDKTKLKDFSKAAKALDLEIHQTPIFNRGQYLPKIGISKEFQSAAFALSDQNAISDVVETVNGYCILHLDTYVPAENDQFEEQKDALAEALVNERKNKAFNDFLTRLRIEARLVDYVSEQKNRGL